MRAQTWTPKKEEFSQAFEKIKNEKENASQPENPQFGTQEIARIISEVTGERAETIRPVELIPEKEEQPAPIPQEELPGQLPPENESGLPEEAEYEEGLEEPNGGEEYGQEPEDEQKPKLGFGRRLKAFFKNLVTLPEEMCIRDRSTTRQAGISSPCSWLPLPPLWPCPFTGSGKS